MEPSDKPAQVTVTLSKELAAFVDGEVRRGVSASSSEYVRSLLRQRYLETRERATRLQEVDAAIAQGIADADAGRVMSLDEAFARLRAELDLPESAL